MNQSFITNSLSRSVSKVWLRHLKMKNPMPVSCTSNIMIDGGLTSRQALQAIMRSSCTAASCVYVCVLFVFFAFVYSVMSGRSVYVLFVSEIRWISCSLTQMFIRVSGVSYVSWCRLKLAMLSDSLVWSKRCREETTVCVSKSQDIECS